MKFTDLSAIPNTGITIVVDGGCTNNNLPETTRTMYGSFAVFFNGTRVEKITHYGVTVPHQYKWECDMPGWRKATPNIPATNNVAECEMMAQALAYAVRISKSPKYNKIVFMGDSQVVESYTKPGSKVGKDAKHLAQHQDVISTAFKNNSNFSYIHMDDKTVKAILGH
jgi:ribonuclease HI